MANPQIEDGYTKISNELLEAIIKAPMSDYEHRVFWFIIRKTYGFEKKQDWISQKQIVEYTGIKKSHVSRTIKKLLFKNMIVKNGKYLAIQKDYELWKLPKQVTKKSYLNRYQKLPKQVTEVTQTGNQSYLNRGTQNKIIQNKIIQNKIIQKKNVRKEFPEDSIEYQLAKYLFEKIKTNNPEHKKPNLASWSKHIDYMIRIDKRDPTKIREVIDWCQRDGFWHKNILSTAKLREKYDQLILNMKGNRNGKKHFSSERDYTADEQRKIDEKFFS